jgi:hypothetical protein
MASRIIEKSQHQTEAMPMRIFIFKSEANPGLRAFSSDLAAPSYRINSGHGVRSAPSHLIGICRATRSKLQSKTMASNFGVSAKSTQASNHSPGDPAFGGLRRFSR